LKVNYELVTATVDGTLLVTHKEKNNEKKIMISSIKYILTLTSTQTHYIDIITGSRNPTPEWNRDTV
jgi:hypothetical protein